MAKPKTTEELKEQVMTDLDDLKNEGVSTLGFQIMNPVIDATRTDLKKETRPVNEPAPLRDSETGEVEKTIMKEQDEMSRLAAENKRLKEMLAARVTADTEINSKFDQQMASLKASKIRTPELRILPTENHKLSLNKDMWSLKKGVPIFVPTEAARRAVNAKVATLI